eukprot:403344996
MLQYDEDGVIVVNGDNVESVIELHRGNVLIELYAPWCGHCQKLAPEFAAASKRLVQDNPPFALLKGDAGNDKKLSKKFNVKGYPNIFFFKAYEKFKYNGPRTEEGIVNWVSSRLHPFLQVLSCDDLENIHTQKEVSLVYFGDSNQTEAFANVMEVASKRDTTYDLYRYYQVIGEKSCALKYGVEDYPGFSVFRNFRPKVKVYPQGSPHEFLDVIDFVHKAAIPEVIEFRPEYAHYIFGASSSNQIVVFREKMEDTAQIEDWLHLLKDKYIKKLTFALSLVETDLQKKFLDYYGINQTVDQLPAIRFGDKFQRKFKYEGDLKDLTLEKLDQLIQDFLTQKLTPYYKSEPIPSAEESSSLVDGLFQQVVGLNFKEQVVEAGQDVLMFYTRQNCDACLKVQTVIKELSLTPEVAESNIKFAIMDDTLNDHPGRNGHGSPQLRMYKFLSKTYNDYNGKNLQFDKIKQWILTNNSEAKKQENKEAKVEDL